MASEVRLQVSLLINKGTFQYTSSPNSFVGDMDNYGGPTPGTITVPTTGIDVDLAELSQPGWAWIQNLDPTNYVTLGIHDGSVLHPFGELLPGMMFPIFLSRSLGEEHTIAGTATTGNVNTLHIKANGASCKVRFDAMER